MIVAGRAGLVLNADDPLVADLGRHAPGPVYFGVDDDSLALPELQHASDSKHCRRCGHAYTYEAVYLAHLGHYRCPNCGQERPEPDRRGHGRRAARDPLRRVHAARARASSSRSPASTTSTTRSAPPRSRSALGVALDDVVAGLQAVAPAFGRAETLDLGGRPTSILLVKNPAGANEVLRTLALEGGELDLLGVLNDRTADGRDVSWVWDADWELLVGRVRRMTCSGHARRRARAADEVRRAWTRTASTSSTSSSTGSTRRSRTATARSTSSPPTPRCSSCASC